MYSEQVVLLDWPLLTLQGINDLSQEAAADQEHLEQQKQQQQQHQSQGFNYDAAQESGDTEDAGNQTSCQ